MAFQIHRAEYPHVNMMWIQNCYGRPQKIRCTDYMEFNDLLELILPRPNATFSIAGYSTADNFIATQTIQPKIFITVSISCTCALIDAFQVLRPRSIPSKAKMEKFHFSIRQPQKVIFNGMDETRLTQFFFFYLLKVKCDSSKVSYGKCSGRSTRGIELFLT